MHGLKILLNLNDIVKYQITCNYTMDSNSTKYTSRYKPKKYKFGKVAITVMVL